MVRFFMKYDEMWFGQLFELYNIPNLHSRLVIRNLSCFYFMLPSSFICFVSSHLFVCLFMSELVSLHISSISYQCNAYHASHRVNIFVLLCRDSVPLHNNCQAMVWKDEFTVSRLSFDMFIKSSHQTLMWTKIHRRALLRRAPAYQS